MTDWTTPEDVPEVVRERLHDWLNTGNPAHATTLANFAVAEVIRAFWPAPARTLASDLADITEHWEEWATDTIIEELTAATTRAAKMGHDLAEARAELERVRSELAEVTHARDSLREDYDHARAEVERLNRERDRLQAQVQGLTRRDSEHNSEVRMLTEERDEARADVDRLTAERDRIANGRNITYAEVDGKPVDADTPRPDDVKEEEPYHIYYGVYGNDHTVGVRIGGKWRCIGDDNGVRVTDDNIVSLTRLVPAPRVITDPDDLDRLAEGAVVLSLSTQYALQRRGAGGEWYCQATKGKATSADVISCGPVTVLWEPVA